MCTNLRACVFHDCCAHAPCGLAAAAAWPESRPPVRHLWECGELGPDQLIKHCCLALCCFPTDGGSSDRWGSHTGGQRQEFLSPTASFFFLLLLLLPPPRSHTHCSSSADRGFRTSLLSASEVASLGIVSLHLKRAESGVVLQAAFFFSPRLVLSALKYCPLILCLFVCAALRLR